MTCNTIQTKTIKQGYSDDVIATVTDSSGNPLDLTSYDGVQFIMVGDDDVVKVNDTATFVDKPTGKIKYTLSTTDTATTGNFRAYFRLSIGGVPKKSAPESYFYVSIIEDLI